MSTRTIRVFTSRGNKQTISTDAKTWGELKPLVEEHYDLSNLQPAESVNKTTLIHRDAVLPEGEFVLFLRPIKTKAGSGESYASEAIENLKRCMSVPNKIATAMEAIQSTIPVFDELGESHIVSELESSLEVMADYVSENFDCVSENETFSGYDYLSEEEQDLLDEMNDGFDLD